MFPFERNKVQLVYIWFDLPSFLKVTESTRHSHNWGVLASHITIWGCYLSSVVSTENIHVAYVFVWGYVRCAYVMDSVGDNTLSWGSPLCRKKGDNVSVLNGTERLWRESENSFSVKSDIPRCSTLHCKPDSHTFSNIMFMSRWIMLQFIPFPFVSYISSLVTRRDDVLRLIILKPHWYVLYKL